MEDHYSRTELEFNGVRFQPPKGFDLARAHTYTEERTDGQVQNRARIARWDRLTEELGGREEVIRCLEFVDQPSAQLLLVALQHPEYDVRPMAFIAFGAKVTEPQFRGLVTHGLKLKNAYDAARATAPKIHAVVSDLGDDAMSQVVKCQNCRGSGVVESDECPNCDGEGTVRMRANVKKQELFLRQAGLIQEGGGVNVTTHVTMQAAIGSLPSLEEVVRTRPIPVERVE